jgi:hypothetical protein
LSPKLWKNWGFFLGYFRVKYHNFTENIRVKIRVFWCFLGHPKKKKIVPGLKAPGIFFENFSMGVGKFLGLGGSKY